MNIIEFLLLLLLGEACSFVFVYCGHFARLYLRRHGFSSNKTIFFIFAGLMGAKLSVIFLSLAYFTAIEPWILKIIK